MSMSRAGHVHVHPSASTSMYWRHPLKRRLVAVVKRYANMRPKTKLAKNSLPKETHLTVKMWDFGESVGAALVISCQLRLSRAKIYQWIMRLKLIYPHKFVEYEFVEYAEK